MLTEQQLCEACGGGCCSFKRLGISWDGWEGSKTLKEFLDSKSKEDFSELLNKDGSLPTMRFYRLKDEKGKHNILFECASFKDGRCAIYKNRPKMCSEFKCPVLKREMSISEFIATHPPKPTKSKRDITKVMMRYIRRARK